MLIASASPFASAIFASAFPNACASNCLASTSILTKSFSAFSARCSASTLASIACANNIENWKSVIDTISVVMLKSARRAVISS